MNTKKGLFINGALADSSHDEVVEIINPATEEVICTVTTTAKEDVHLAVQAAKEAFQTWKETTPAERSELLFQLATVVRENVDELAEIEAENVGKPLANAKGEIEAVADNLAFFASAARNVSGLNTGEYVKGRTSMIRREPIGVVGSITPWNYPLMMTAWKIGPALAAGNTVVLKPSELTPLSTLRFAELTSDILPKGVLNIVTGYGTTVGAEIVKHKDVAMISLTGSVRAGQAVAQNATAQVKRLHLELGGKAPFIVFDDADIDAAVSGARVGAFYNSGQDCTAATRIYVQETIYDTFIDKLVAAVKSIKVGSPTDPETEMGPLVSKQHRERVHGFVERAQQNKNVRILTGGQMLDGKGYYYAPTVIVGTNQSDEIVQEEVFGPVITVMPFKDEAEAVQLANDSKYALSASVWTKSIDKAMRLIKQIEAGTVWTNNHLALTSEMPHGGSKLSGYGNDQSMFSLEEYTTIKHAMIKHE